MPTIALQDLIALNDEIRALVRAGVPLEKGLRSLGTDLPGRLGALAQSLVEQLERGQSLADAVDDSSYSFPRIYRAVVAAGLRSGRLAAALEGLAITARRAADLRRAMIVSLVYPLFLVVVASGLLSFMASRIAPIMGTLYETLGFEQPWWYRQVIRLWQHESPATVIFWMLLGMIVVTWFIGRRSSSVLQTRGVVGFPTVQGMHHAGRMAGFAEMLALLIENQVPLDEAVQLAAASSGDRRLERAGDEVAQRLRRGTRPREWPAGIPPLLGWLISSGARGEQLVRILRRSAADYRRRALRMGEALTTYLPILIAGGVGGVVTLCFALIVFVPFYHLLRLLALP